MKKKNELFGFKVEQFKGPKIRESDGWEHYTEEYEFGFITTNLNGEDERLEQILFTAPASMYYSKCTCGYDVGDDYLLVFESITYHPCSSCGMFHEITLRSNKNEFRKLFV